jgi:quercetin dioxygenase-like cupin family protein
MKLRTALAALLVTALAAQTAHEVEVTAEPHHHLALENQYVHVFKVEVAPHEATLMHRHRYDYVFVTLGDSEVSNEVEGKPPVTLKLKDGETRFAPGNFAHVARNLAGTPFRNLTIELLPDQQAHQSPPPKWDEERGLKVYDRGSQDIMFVRDDVRVSEIDLQPGGVIPKHEHVGPQLVVALTDLELSTAVEGKAPRTVTQKASEFKWLPGGYKHTLTNLGKQPAKYITLEFH